MTACSRCWRSRPPTVSSTTSSARCSPAGTWSIPWPATPRHGRWRSSRPRHAGRDGRRHLGREVYSVDLGCAGRPQGGRPRRPPSAPLPSSRPSGRRPPPRSAAATPGIARRGHHGHTWSGAPAEPSFCRAADSRTATSSWQLAEAASRSASNTRPSRSVTRRRAPMRFEARPKEGSAAPASPITRRASSTLAPRAVVGEGPITRPGDGGRHRRGGGEGGNGQLGRRAPAWVAPATRQRSTDATPRPRGGRPTSRPPVSRAAATP